MLSSLNDKAFKGLFAICVLKFSILVSLTGLAFSICQGYRRVDRASKRTFFGFRIALILFTISALFNVVFETVELLGADTSTSWYFFWLLGVPVNGVARAMTAYAMIRVAQYPLRLVRPQPYPWRISHFVAACSALGSFLFFVFEAKYTANNQIAGLAGPPNPITGYDALFERASSAPLGLVDSGFHLFVGAMCAGVVIYNSAELAKVNVSPKLKKAIKFMMIAALVWVVSGFVLMGLYAGGNGLLSFAIDPDAAKVGIVAVDMVEVGTVSMLFVLCIRRMKSLQLR